MQGQEHRPEIHCKHFFYGYPYGTPVTNDLIIRDVYALSNNDETKLADWVAYMLDKKIISGPKRNRYWRPDPWLEADETLEPRPTDDYKGAHGTLGTDRGHQAPLGSFDGHKDWADTNYLSNITPQRSDLNRGVWVKLEKKIRSMVKELGTIWVMTGPLYERDMAPLPKADEPHKVPSGYWKIVFYESNWGAIEASAFIFEQETPRNAKILHHLTTINEIEQRSGLDFLWLLSDDREEAIENDKNEDWAEKHFM